MPATLRLLTSALVALTLQVAARRANDPYDEGHEKSAVNLGGLAEPSRTSTGALKLDPAFKGSAKVWQHAEEEETGEKTQGHPSGGGIGQSPAALVHDIRENLVQAAEAESLWAVRVLRQAGVPNERLAEIWPAEWPQPPGAPTLVGLLQAWLHQTLGMKLEVGDSREHPDDLPWKLCNPDSDFRRRLDERLQVRMYAEAKGRDPKCTPKQLSLRYKFTRQARIFRKRGREDTNASFVRRDSFKNKHAGIVALESLTPELKDFFREDLEHHGKNLNQRIGRHGTDAEFKRAGAPFIAGASSTILALILTMEDTLDGKHPFGVVPCGGMSRAETSLGKKILKYLTCEGVPKKLVPDQHPREALVGLMTAVLIVAGHHSLGECLVVAQRMGYFEWIPRFLRSGYGEAEVSYAVAAAKFERYLGRLGLTGSDGVLTSRAAADR